MKEWEIDQTTSNYECLHFYGDSGDKRLCVHPSRIKKDDPWAKGCNKKDCPIKKDGERREG